MSKPLQKNLEDLKEIIIKCASGDARAQATLYELFAPKMFGVCLRYGSNAAEAEDNLQEGFIRIFKYIGNFRHEGSFEGWVRRIMVNVSLEKYRKQFTVYPVEDMTIYDSVNFSEDTLAEISAKELVELIQELSPAYRMVFNLFVMEGMTHREISYELGISEGTSKSNLARAREVLKRKVKKLYSEAGKNEGQ